MAPIASTSTSAHLPPLGVHVREELGAELEVTLHELIGLSLLGKQLHWCVVGRLFRPLHLQLDELVDSWRELSDTIAERAVALGHFPDGQAAAVHAGSQLPPLERGAVADETVIRELSVRLSEAVERIRIRMDRVGELDVASQDVLVEVLRALEEQLWMIRAQSQT